ncbi:hypothetical protein [Rhizobium skierniewicense]|uniref:hypothetical protein n=1 Tax=Rhizobium skierniewicense TaxID=984260 RepID=UPI0015744C22|nr:hypothetical protein [Rhizobium skierniewicense]NTF32572.1 hypothetical protein [Rhizobium skierniewicense]
MTVIEFPMVLDGSGFAGPYQFNDDRQTQNSDVFKSSGNHLTLSTTLGAKTKSPPGQTERADAESNDEGDQCSFLE